MMLHASRGEIVKQGPMRCMLNYEYKCQFQCNDDRSLLLYPCMCPHTVPNMGDAYMVAVPILYL